MSLVETFWKSTEYHSIANKIKHIIGYWLINSTHMFGLVNPIHSKPQHVILNCNLLIKSPTIRVRSYEGVCNASFKIVHKSFVSCFNSNVDLNHILNCMPLKKKWMNYNVNKFIYQMIAHSEFHNKCLWNLKKKIILAANLAASRLHEIWW